MFCKGGHVCRIKTGFLVLAASNALNIFFLDTLPIFETFLTIRVVELPFVAISFFLNDFFLSFRLIFHFFSFCKFYIIIQGASFYHRFAFDWGN